MKTWLAKTILDALNSEEFEAISKLPAYKEATRHFGEFDKDGKSGWKHIHRALRMYDFSVEAKTLVETTVNQKSLLNNSRGKKDKLLHLEHAVPASVIRQLLEELRESKEIGTITLEEVLEILNLGKIVIITTKEAELLDKSVKSGGLGLKSSMPTNWDKKDQLARLTAAGIKV